MKRAIFIAATMLVVAQAFTSPVTTVHRSTPTKLEAVVSLKPAATPLMDSGKAFARSGELLIDVTSQIDLYGGALSTTGALIRNSGDCIAQAAASCRFKTALELVCDELRESGSSLKEATSKLKLAAEEAKADKNEDLARLIEASVPAMNDLAGSLEQAGAAILQKKTEQDVGDYFLSSSKSMETLSVQIRSFAPGLKDSLDAGQRMTLAAERMKDAGFELTGSKPESSKPKGKSWIKG